MLDFEEKARQKGFQWIIGVDEAGRGPLAGPVVAAAVALQNTRFQSRIDDSKKLTPRQREQSFIEIFENAFVGIGIMSEAVIDEVNILQATYLAMSNAVEQLIDKIPFEVQARNDFPQMVCLLIDGNSFKSDLPYTYQTITSGDGLSLSIAAASIIAKVTRDRILRTYDQIFPQYGLRRHKGYPTLQHKLAIRQFGPSVIHRKTFTY